MTSSQTKYTVKNVWLLFQLIIIKELLPQAFFGLLNFSVQVLVEQKHFLGPNLR